MSRSLKSLAAICAMAVLAAGCTKTEINDNSDGSSSQSSQISSVSGNSGGDVHVDAEQAPISAGEVMTESATCTIEFSDSGINVSGKGASVSNTTVTISTKGVYYLSGTSSDAKVLIEADKDDIITLVLDGLSLTSKNGAVIDCEEAQELVICTKGGSVNSLSDSTNYTFASDKTEPDAAVFCRSDLTLLGEGTLKVTGNYNDAIKGKDNLQIVSGTYSIKSESDGIIGKDSVKIFDGTITIESGKDGIKSSQDNDPSLGFVTINGGNISISSGRDGIQAETQLTVYAGNIEIVSGGDAAYKEVSSDGGMTPGNHTHGGDWGYWGNPSGGSSATTSEASTKGLKAGGDITIYNKETVINITSADDAIHSNANVTISNGKLTLSSCDDGIHADELLTVDNGTITITKSYEGLEGKNIAINGGVIDLKTADDGLNAAGGDNGDFFGFGGGDYYISITGGDITINADGDGIDSNGTVAMSGGRVVVYGPTNSNNGALDYEKSFTLSGGELIALGSVGMAQAPSALSQPCLSITANVSANSKLEVRAEDGTVIMGTTTPKNCQSLIFSSSSLKEGSSYSIYSDNTLLYTVTAQNGVSGNGANGSGGFGGGGNPGGFGGGGHPGGGPGGGNPGGGPGGGNHGGNL
ncbi:MAG: carbohydrate-binding domain-containing protein [Oscillospiraceae bacterium]|nr:carbohydrate-binding domain-containing protein [Oscillospiraceae bacterium]